MATSSPHDDDPADPTGDRTVPRAEGHAPEPRVGGSILGTRVARIEDRALVTRGGRYTANVSDPRLDGVGQAVFVRSPVAHARVIGIDTAAAAASPGVTAVLTAADLGLPDPQPRYGSAVSEPYLATDTVRYVGQAIALVVADTEAQAADAADLVLVDFDPLPAVVDVESAADDTVLLFADMGTNTVKTLGGEEDPHLFDGCEVVVTQRIVNNRVAPAPMEGRAAVAVWSTADDAVPDHDGTNGAVSDHDGTVADDDGTNGAVADVDGTHDAGPGGAAASDRLTMWLPNQGAQLAQSDLAAAFGVDKQQIHVITPDVGGAFGAKFGAEPDHIAIAAAAHRLRRPVRWIETRSENLTAMNHGRAQLHTVTIGGSRDGRMIAYRLDVLQDCGAYPRLALQTPTGTTLMAPGVYGFDRVEARARCVLSTTTPVGAFRGAGRPEATAALERTVDVFADHIGMDPAAVRRQNLLPRFTSPHTTPTGAVYDSGDYPQALTRALDAADYAALRREQAERRTRHDDVQLGIGLSSYVEITGGGKENATVTVHASGRVEVRTGVSPHGQGHATAFAMIVADQLGVSVEDVDLVWGDTDLVPRGGGTGGSRSLQMGGAAAYDATVRLVDLAKERAAELLEIDPADLVVDRPRAGVGVAGIPDRFITFTDLAAAQPEQQLSAAALFAADGSTYPFGAHVAVVEVDIATGKAVLRRLVAVDDAGTVVNPMLFDGQRHGGLAQGASQALYEGVTFDTDGNPTTATFADYAIPSAPDLPSFELVAMATPTPYNPLGAKGIGEAATIGATPAVQNAVIDAVRHLGVGHIDMPLTPQRVWRAIADAAAR